MKTFLTLSLLAFLLTTASCGKDESGDKPAQPAQGESSGDEAKGARTSQQGSQKDEGAEPDKASQGAGGQPGGEKPKLEVKYITIKPRQISVSDELPGRVIAYKTAEIRPQVNGIILSRTFDEGSVVQEGQQLYQIDPRPFEAELKTAQAQLLRARAQLKSVQALAARYDRLIKANAISRQEYDDAVASLDQAKADVAVAQAQVDTAKINLDYTKVYAPISGYVGTSAFTEGALVSAQQEAPLAVVRQLDPVYVDLSQSGAKAMQLRSKIAGAQMRGNIKESAPVTLMLDDLDKPYNLAGQLQMADMAIDGQTGAVQLRATFPNPDGILLPGLFVRAYVEQAGESEVIVVPQRAVGRDPQGQAVVWVIKADDTVDQRIVQTGAAYQDHWIITGGLAAGERVVVEGGLKLQKGAPVKAVAMIEDNPGEDVRQVPPEGSSERATPEGAKMEEESPTAQAGPGGGGQGGEGATGEASESGGESSGNRE